MPLPEVRAMCYPGDAEHPDSRSVHPQERHRLYLVPCGEVEQEKPGPVPGVAMLGGRVQYELERTVAVPLGGTAWGWRSRL